MTLAIVGYFYNFFSISLCIRTDSLLQEKSDTLCVARYIKCVKLFFKGYTNRLEIADNDITIHSFNLVLHVRSPVLLFPALAFSIPFLYTSIYRFSAAVQPAVD